ncbi:Hint domain-containing protein [Acidiphilium sp.]|uniref:Hint domain-containing protein n=1 Tax=Acidiphilium sp. TaxID=527 RepID=UPI003D05998A
MAMITDAFSPTTSPAPDWSAAANWSGGVVPGAGMAAEITGLSAVVDPGVTIEADVALTSSGSQSAALSGNDGAVVLGQSAEVSIVGTADLFASDSVVNQGVMAIGTGSALSVVVDLGAISGLTGAAAPSFANNGMIDLSSGAALEIGGTEFENIGTVALTGGTIDVIGGAIGGGGTIELSQGAMASFGDGVAAQSFSFGSGFATISLADPLLGAGVTLSGFSGGDSVLLPDLAGISLNQANGMVTILNNSGLVEGSFALESGPSLTVIAAGTGSAIVAAGTTDTTSNDAPCFTRGTAVLTPGGYRPVEQLAVGDAVVTARGGVQPIIWVGSRTLDLAAHATPVRVQPIRIAPGALAPGVPRRALRVSPDHSIFLDGVLIPAKLLINGATIYQERDCLAVTYHHIELERHDVILAEAAPCETYLDTGNRAGFTIAASWPVRQKRWDRDACATLVTTGPALRTARTRLHSRALKLGFTTCDDRAIRLWVNGRAAPTDAAGRFTLPLVHTGRAVLRSRRFVPADFDPTSEDRRELGVAIAGLRAGRRRFDPGDLAETGFHPRAAGDTAIWTDGAGVIRLPPGARSIGIDLAAVPLTWEHRGSTP